MLATASAANAPFERPNMDPVTFEVLRNALVNVTEEMALTIRRAAYSTNIKTRADFSCAFFDNALQCVAQSFAQPAHLVSMATIAPASILEYGPDRLQPGDALLVNDPHRGSSHLNDIACISPVFVGSERIGFLANMAHHVDVGGSSPASLGINREIFQEGLILPPTRVASGNQIDPNVLGLILANIRAPRETNGDLHRQLASGYENQCAEAFRHCGVRSEEVQQRQREGSGLAGTGCRLTENVATCEQRRDRFLLDRSRLLVP